MIAETPRPKPGETAEIVAPPAPARRIADLPEDEKPREKMLKQGPGSLSDPELLAIFFATGTRGLSAIDLGRLLIEKHRTLTALSRLTSADFMDQRGIGEAKALHLAAAFELGKRLAQQTYTDEVMDRPDAVVGLLAAEMRAEPCEVLKVVLLNVRNRMVGVETVSRGSVDQTSAMVRDVLQPVIARRAPRFVVVHNHPSGDPTPSFQDREFTRRLREVSPALEVQFFDHIIIGLPSAHHKGYFSFRENGMA